MSFSGGFNIDDHIDYRQYYGDRVKGLKTSGSSLIATCFCPFHGDKNSRSMSINMKTGQWTCHAECGEGNVYSFHAQLYGMSAEDARKQLHDQYIPAHLRQKTGTDQAYPVPVRKTPDLQLVKPADPLSDRNVIPESIWNQMGKLSDDWVSRLMKDRGWSPAVMRKFDMRLQTVRQDKQGRIHQIANPERVAIPMRNSDGELINIRLYKPWNRKPKDGKMISWRAGHGQNVMLFCAEHDGKPIFVVEGEPDFYCAVSKGLNAATHTAKPKTWKHEDKEKFRGHKVIPAGDADKAGKRFNNNVSMNINGIAEYVYPDLGWPDFMKGENGELPDKHGEDLTDYFVKYKKTAKKLMDAVEKKNSIKVKERLSSALDVISDDADGRPMFFTNKMHFRKMKEWAADLLLQHNAPPEIFHQSNGLVEIRQQPDGSVSTKILGTSEIRNRLAEVGNWYTGKGNAKTGEIVPSTAVSPPINICEGILSDYEILQRFPKLDRITTFPYFDSTGKLHIKPGYNESAGVYYFLNDERLRNIDIPENPTKKDLIKVWDIFMDLLGEFPFEEKNLEACFHNAVSLMLLPFCREMIDGPTPLYMIEASDAGAGKSKLATVLSIPATGKIELPVRQEGKNPEDWQKIITTYLGETPTHILFDNILYYINSGALASALTARHWSDRLFGTNDQAVSVPIRTCWIATANNPTASEEIYRRLIVIRLVPGDDNVERAKEYTHDPLEKYALENREKLVWACLTAIQNWVANGRQKHPVYRLASFESWSEVMGSILFEIDAKDFQKNRGARDGGSSERDGYLHLIEKWWAQHLTLEIASKPLYGIVSEEGIALGLSGSDQARRTQFGKKLLGLVDRVFTLENGLKVRVKKGGTYQGARLFYLEKVMIDGGS